MGVAGETVSEISDVFEKADSESESWLKPFIAVSVLTGSAIAGRVALQALPSVESVVPVAIAIGFFFNKNAGFSSGFTGYSVSNFMVFGGQGLWTVFQCLGAGFAGAVGYYFSEISESKVSFFGAMVSGTLVYEFFVNAGSLVFMPTGSYFLLAAAIPFVMVHIASSIGFGLILYGTRKDIRQFAKR